MSENKCVFCGNPAIHTVKRSFFEMDTLEVKTHEIHLCEDCKTRTDLNEIMDKIKDARSAEITFERAKYYFSIRLALAIRVAPDTETDFYKVQILYPGYIGEIFFDKNTLQPMMAGVKLAKDYAEKK